MLASSDECAPGRRDDVDLSRELASASARGLGHSAKVISCACDPELITETASGPGVELVTDAGSLLDLTNLEGEMSRSLRIPLNGADIFVLHWMRPKLRLNATRDAKG